MSCELTRRYVPGYLDGELNLDRTIEIEAHLKGCPACAQEFETLKALRSAMQRGSLAYAAPAVLRERIQSSLGAPGGAEVQSRKFQWPALNLWQLAGAFVLLALFSVGGWELTARLQPLGDRQIAAEIFASHVRSLEGNHLMDVVSTDQHTVKPWFDGKLDFSPPVEDLAENGFPLVGGRLDYIGRREVAALIYQRRKHFINVFMWPNPAAGMSARTVESQQGYNVMEWSRDGFEYWAASDVAESDLAEFVRLLEARTPPDSK